jgi:hypothetical protein
VNLSLAWCSLARLCGFCRVAAVVCCLELCACCVSHYRHTSVATALAYRATESPVGCGTSTNDSSRVARVRDSGNAKLCVSPRDNESGGNRTLLITRTPMKVQTFVEAESLTTGVLDMFSISNSRMSPEIIHYDIAPSARIGGRDDVSGRRPIPVLAFDDDAARARQPIKQFAANSRTSSRGRSPQ